MYIYVIGSLSRSYIRRSSRGVVRADGFWAAANKDTVTGRVTSPWRRGSPRLCSITPRNAWRTYHPPIAH